MRGGPAGGGRVDRGATRTHHSAEGVLQIPLERLLDDSAWLESADPWRFRYLAHEESVVWGLTERIVAGLAPKLRQALDPEGG